MANSKNDDMDRIGNRNTPQGSTTPGSQGSTQDPINRDREMNRDRERGQGSSGNEQGGDSFGSTNPGSTSRDSDEFGSE